MDEKRRGGDPIIVAVEMVRRLVAAMQLGE
jgi:hypothetical protein